MLLKHGGAITCLTECMSYYTYNLFSNVNIYTFVWKVVPCFFRSVCGIFNVLQNFFGKGFETGLWLIVLNNIREDLEVEPFADVIQAALNLVPRSPTVIRKGDVVKFDFEHAQCKRGPKYGLFYHCACSYSLL